MKKRVGQIVGAVFLAIAIALTQVPASFAEAIGGGADFEKNGDKLVAYTGTAEAVSVPNGIKTVCAEAFAGNPYIKSVSFPSSVEIIENGAFRNCSNLERVNFSYGQSEIGSGAFAMCEKLYQVNFSDTILSLGAGVFAGDNQLKSVNLGKNPYFVMEKGVLYDREKTRLIQYFSANETEKFTMPDSVTDVERYAFWGSRNLEEVVLSANLYVIPEYAFSNCTDLKSVSVPYSVRKIGAKAFENCTRLGNINLPVSVTSIHATAFDGCKKVRIVADEGTTAYEFYENYKQEQTSDGSSSVSENALTHLYDTGAADTESVSDNTAKVTAPSGGDRSRYNPSKPADVSGLNVSDYYADDAADVLGKARVVANQAVILSDGISSAGQSVTGADADSDGAQQGGFTPQMNIPDDGSHKIRQKAYYQDGTLTDVTLQNSITDIDDLAFARSALTGILIPEGVTHIGYGAFYHCDQLTYVSIPSTVSDIEPEAFAQTPYLENWKNSPDGSDFLIVGDGILIAYKGNAGVVELPHGVKKIAGGAFADHTEIFKVECQDGLTEIGEGAFAGCSQLSSLSGMGHVKKIADRAFAGCPLTQIHLGNDVTQVGLGAFSGNAADSVVFEALQTLPKLSYEQTATRYDNDQYRVQPFGDISVAVVSDGISSFENTLLDEDYLGMKGLVVSLPNGRDSALRTARLEYCTLLPKDGEKNLKIPSSVNIDGKSYSITSADPDAFAPYTRLSEWTQQEISAILLPQDLGQISDYEPDLVLGAAASIPSDNAGASADENTQNTEQDAKEESPELVETVLLGSDYPMAENITAQVKDDMGRYQLIVNQTQREDDLRQAVSKAYGEPVTGQLLTFDLKMVEEKSGIPISAFGQGQVSVTVPISETMYGQQICAVSLREDDSLELLYGSKNETEDGYSFTFRTDHFSPYGIYAGIGEISQQIKEATDALHGMDASPDTGDPFDPRWLLVAAFGCIGLFLIINGRKRESI